MNDSLLKRQVLVAGMIFHHRWLDPEGLLAALGDWPGNVPLVEWLGEQHLLTPEQLAQLNGELDARSGTTETDTRKHAVPPGVDHEAATRMPPPAGGPAESATVDLRPGFRENRPASVSSRTRYAKIRPHARGGLGEVFVARDVELQREVALKEIQAHIDDPEARVRFVREAEITGQLEHPGIVPVYGLGVYPNGRPYYAMRFIQGEGMDRAIERYHRGKHEPLELRQLLGRFVAVCQALAFAHSRGIIHRDLKPANIMLGAFGETLVVDWGLATRQRVNIGSPREPSSLDSDSVSGDATRQEGVMGTPAYMPPEQAAGRHDLMGPASDQFALGATLYCLLAGQPPYQGNDAIFKASLGEWKPVRQIRPDVPPALEAICARAMATDPAKRYASVSDLAQEVERWLADEPVMAYREPWPDRARRWARKHRTWVTSALVFLLVTLVALGVGLFAVRAEERRTASERDRAIEAETEARANLELATINQVRAERAEIAARANLVRAEANLGLAKKAVNECFAIATTHPLLRQGTMKEVKRLLLEQSLPFYKGFQTARPDDLEARKELAVQWSRVGYITGEMGNKKESLRAYEQARMIIESLTKAQPGVALHHNNLAGVSANIGDLWNSMGQPEKAVALYKQAIATLRQLIRDHPRVGKYYDDLAGVLINLGSVQDSQRKHSEAAKTYKAARVLLEMLVTQFPRKPAYRLRLAGTAMNQAVCQLHMGNKEEAARRYREAIDLLTPLTVGTPSVATHDLHASALHNIAVLLAGQNKKREALAESLKARDLRLLLVRIEPKVIKFRWGLVHCCFDRASWLGQLGQPAEAVSDLGVAEAQLKEIRKINPDADKVSAKLKSVYTARARQLTLLKRHREAAADWTRVIDLSEEKDRRALAFTRLECLVAAGMHPESIVELQRLGTIKNPSNEDRYRLACLAGRGFNVLLAAPHRPLPERERLGMHYLIRAVNWLVNLEQGGYLKDKTRRANVTGGIDFAMMRHFDTYQRLLRWMRGRK